MLTAETRDFLESGCALIIATVSSTGEPFASRGWGLDVLDDAGRVRLLLESGDRQALENLQDTGRIAITAAHVPTLHALQLKGNYVGSHPGNERDRAKAAQYADEFFADIEATDGSPRALLERLLPDDYVACEIVIEELYDQTPGPGAGASVPMP